MNPLIRPLYSSYLLFIQDAYFQQNQQGEHTLGNTLAAADQYKLTQESFRRHD